ncbi:MAG: VWA domain-containing protein [Firmicutes bacterium]|nr:VWA domain-containing protein [Bacillota bacterium]
MIDISGSMMGIKLEQAKSALQLCLRNLVAGDSFNIIAFNHACTRFSKKAVPFSQQSLDRAGRWIESLQASGGMEILEPLASCLEGGGGSEDCIILLFTDGRVGNEREVLDFAERHLKKGRIFTFGIDTAVNSYFLNELARVGRGRAEFVYPGERIDEKVLRQFSRIVSPFVEDAQIEWGWQQGERPFSRRIGIIYDMEPLHVFARVKGEPGGNVVLRGRISRIKGKDGDTVFESRIDLNTLPRCSDADLLEKAWAHRIIRELEQELDCMSGRNRKKIEAEIERLSLEHGIISSLTSFVAVEERLEKATGLPVTRPIPVSPPRGWKMSGFSFTWLSDGAVFFRMAEFSGAPYESRVFEDAVFSGMADSSVSLFDASIPCFSIPPRGVWGEQEAPDGPGVAGLLRMLARTQMADGVFADGEAQDLNQKLETTALSLLAFLLSNEDVGIYLNQLRKSLRFILEVLGDGKVRFDLEREADARLCLLLFLALKQSLLRGVVKRKERGAVQGLLGRLEEALQTAARASGKRSDRRQRERNTLNSPRAQQPSWIFWGSPAACRMPEIGKTFPRLCLPATPS